MTAVPVSIQTIIRDPVTGDGISNTCSEGVMDGNTLYLEPGILPEISDTLPGDILITVIPPILQKKFISRTVDENGNQTITLTDHS